MAESGPRPPAAPERLRAQQFELTRHLRDPNVHAAPAGIEDRRLAIYRDLFFSNIDGLLSANFPVVSQLLGTAAWQALVREFYRDYRCRTPLFPEIGREFLRFLDAREPNGQPAFLAELAHYEWVELALQLHEPDPETFIADPGGDLLDGVPVFSPLAWVLAYQWPVHRLGPAHQPEVPPDAPTLLLLRREPDGNVRFSELSPLAFRLAQRLSETPDLEGPVGEHDLVEHALTGREQLLALADEAGTADRVSFIEQGHVLLRQMLDQGVLLGVRPASRNG